MMLMMLAPCASIISIIGGSFLHEAVRGKGGGWDGLACVARSWVQPLKHCILLIRNAGTPQAPNALHSGRILALQEFAKHRNLTAELKGLQLQTSYSWFNVYCPRLGSVFRYLLLLDRRPVLSDWQARVG